MRDDRGIGAKGDLDTSFDGAAQAVLGKGQHRFGLLANRRRKQVERDRIGEHGGRNQPGAMLLHQGECVVIEHRTVLNRSYAGPHRCLDALGAVRVCGHRDAVAAGFLDDHPHFGFRELLCSNQFLPAEHAGRRADFDDLGAMLDLIARGVQQSVGAIGDARLRIGLAHARGVAGDIGVAASNRQGMAGRDHARAHHKAAINRAHQGDVGKAG